MENKNEKMKIKDFKDAVPIMPCQKSSGIMGLSIYAEGTAKISPSWPATIGPLVRIQDILGLY